MVTFAEDQRSTGLLSASFERSSPSMLEPLSSAERVLVAERLRVDITEAAADMLRTEQQTKTKLLALHIKSVTLLTLCACAVAYAMIYLQGVLVPFSLAIFLTFLLEPLLFALLSLPSALGRVFPALRPVADRIEEQKIERQRAKRTQANREELADDISENGSACYSPRRERARSTRDQLGEWKDPGDEICDDGCEPDGPYRERSWSSDLNSIEVSRLDRTRVTFEALSWRAWSFCSVVICLLCLSFFISFLAVVMVQSFHETDWQKYASSKKVRVILDEWFPQIGADPENLSLSSFVPWLVQGFFFDALNFTFTIMSQVFLTFLFLAFLLASDVEMVDNEHFLGLAVKVRFAVRRYIRIKSRIAFGVALVVGAFYWILKVDFAILFAILTLVLSYIPHVGYTIAVLAPLPLVFLDPTKTWGDLAAAFIFPFIVHQFASNLVEPKLLAASLDLHPVTVLLALAFWTSVWGAVGAVLSVPLTAAVRLTLLEVDHPYTLPLVNLLKGRLRNKDSLNKSPFRTSPLGSPSRLSSSSNSPATSATRTSAAQEPQRVHRSPRPAGALPPSPATVSDLGCGRHPARGGPSASNWQDALPTNDTQAEKSPQASAAEDADNESMRPMVVWL